MEESAAGDDLKMIVRDGVQADLPQVAALKVRSWDDTYRPIVGSAVIDQLLDVEQHRRTIQRDLGKSEAFLLVAEAPDGEVIGFAVSYLDEVGEPYLESLHVRPGLRGTGIGAALLRATASRWVAGGFGSMSLHVVAANSTARRFYERLGGVESGTMVDNWQGTSVSLVAYRWPSLIRLLEADLNELRAVTEMPSFELGFRGTALRRQLVAAVLRGEKVATASLREEYQPVTTEPLPAIDRRSVLLGNDDEPLAIVETTDVRVVRAGDIDLQFARDEGEGFETVAQWRAAHERFWADYEITDDTLVVCQWFTVIERE